MRCKNMKKESDKGITDNHLSVKWLSVFWKISLTRIRNALASRELNQYYGNHVHQTGNQD